MKHLARIAGTVGLIHCCEDIALLSLGRFLPVPVWAMYIIGIALSTTILTFLIDKISRRAQSSDGVASPHIS